MHVLYSFSVVKSGEMIRHNYSLHLLRGRSRFKHAEGLAEPAAQQILYLPHLLLCKHMPLKKDSNSITTLKQQRGAKPMAETHPTRMHCYFYPQSRAYWGNTELLLWLNAAKNLTSVNLWKSVTDWMTSASKLLFFLSLKIILDTLVCK